MIGIPTTSSSGRRTYCSVYATITDITYTRNWRSFWLTKNQKFHLEISEEENQKLKKFFGIKEFPSKITIADFTDDTEEFKKLKVSHIVNLSIGYADEEQQLYQKAKPFIVSLDGIKLES